MITVLWDINGKLLSLASDVESSQLTVELLPCTDIRAFVEELENQSSNVELLSQQHRTTQCRPHDLPQVPLQELLTERQFEAIEAAHYGGIYEWPRETTTEDLAATLDISSYTYQYHLRAAEQKLVESILD